MESFEVLLTNLLRNDKRFVADNGDLIKAEVINRAIKMDVDLIRSLLLNRITKDKFFFEVESNYIFNINKFMDYIQDKNFLNDSYTKFKNKIGLTIDSKFLNERGEVALSFPFKDCILEGGQTKVKDTSKEIFYNEVLAQDEIDRLLEPKVLTNFRRYSAAGMNEIKDFKKDNSNTIKENLIIKGNNLLVLYSLKDQFYKKIKLIYIDPPYNTGKDSFGYNDKFNHSTWLTFMKNRLEISRNLLKDDGCICVQCDDNEGAYLKVLMDEIFSRENHLVTFYFQVRYERKTLAEDNDFQKMIEQCLVYAKNVNEIKPNKDTENYPIDKFEWKIIERKQGTKIELGGKSVEIFRPGEYTIEKVTPGNGGLKETWASGNLIRQKGSSGEFLNTYLAPRKEIDGLGCLYKVYAMGEDGLGYRYFTGPKKTEATKGKFYSGIPLQIVSQLKEGEVKKPIPIPNFKDFSAEFGNCRLEGGVDISGGKKPEELIAFIMKRFTVVGDLVMDFHLGSGTTAAVSHKMGRQYIGIEQIDYGKNGSVPRLINVIGKEKTVGKMNPIIEEYDQSGISNSDYSNWRGGGDFIYCELLENNQKFIELISNSNSSSDIFKIYQDLMENDFLKFNIRTQELIHNKEEFKKLPITRQKEILISLLNKNHLYVNISEIEDTFFKVNNKDKDLNKNFYGY